MPPGSPPFPNCLAIPWQAWGKLSEAEQVTATRVHKLDCYQHLRNIFLKEMSAAQAKHVAEELQPHLDAFSSWERMSTEYSQLLRAAYKEFHHGNKCVQLLTLSPLPSFLA